MRGLILLPKAEMQMADALEFTFVRFGEAKYLDYLGLIGAAYTALGTKAEDGKRRPEIHPDAWTHHIARPGRNARHLFLYRIREDVEIARFLHDAMDLRRYWPDEWR